MSSWNLLYLQDANSAIMEYLIFFHDYAMMLIIMITIKISYLMITLMMNNMNNKFILQNQTIEIIWTIIPMFILIFLGIPSLKILYLSDELIMNPILSIKSIGHQWYWKYEYSDFNELEFNSFMNNYSPISKKFNFRLLDVDNRLVIPYNTPIRLLISSMDVIHSWTIPSIGIKIDAIPGRINQTLLLTKSPSILFGQCSEICGMNHSFMPIMIESTNEPNFLKWIHNFQNN